MSEKSLVTVKFGNSTYTIKIDEPTVNVERAAAEIDRRINAHKQASEWMSSEKALALTAIEITDRYIRLKEEVDNVNDRYLEASKQLFYLQKETDELKQQLFLIRSGLEVQPEKTVENVESEQQTFDTAYRYGGEIR